jgi:tRNA(Ile)-lysidine synthase
MVNSPNETEAAPSRDPARLPDRARAFVEHRSMTLAGGHVVALVSGGADSTALLRLLDGGLLAGDRVEGRAIGPSLSVLHVNHLLRGRDADVDEEFVRALCDALGVECVTLRYDVAAYAEREGLNLEDAGRRVRYRLAEEELAARCERTGVPLADGRIATGHTLDDRTETFFMRAIAGAGAAGLSSIRPVRGRVIRPLLGCTRSEIRQWLLEVGQEWREDSTNSDTRRLRALVRNKIVPIAEAINPSFRATLGRSLDLLADDAELLDEMAYAFSDDFANVDAEAGTVAFDRGAMLTLSRPMARRTVRAALLRAFPESTRLEAAHVDALVDGLSLEGFARDLPEGLIAFGEYGRMVVSRRRKALPSVAPGLLELPGTVDLGDAGSMSAADEGSSDLASSTESVVIDATTIEGALTVDGVRPGDRMRPLGMEGTRKLSDLLVDAKVPKRARSAIPVVRDRDRIVWLAGVRMSDEYRVSGSTVRKIRLKWEPRASAYETRPHRSENEERDSRA